MLIDPFQPANTACTLCSVTNASQFFVCPGNGLALDVWNSGVNPVFIETTNAGGIAATVPVGGTAGSYAIGPGLRFTIQTHPGDTGITAIASVAGPTVLFATRGNGS